MRNRGVVFAEGAAGAEVALAAEEVALGGLELVREWEGE